MSKEIHMFIRIVVKNDDCVIVAVFAAGYECSFNVTKRNETMIRVETKNEKICCDVSITYI